MECEIDYVATVHFDFVVQDDKDELIDFLRSLYEDVEDRETMPLSLSGVGERSRSLTFRNPYNLDDFPVRNTDYIDSVFSYAFDLRSSVIGMVTFAFVSDEEKKKIQQEDVKEARNRVTRHVYNFKEFRESIPSITDAQSPCDIVYFELEEPKLEPEQAHSTEVLHEMWNDCGGKLNKYYVEFGGSLSKLDIDGSVYLLTPRVMSKPLGSLSLVNLTPCINEKEDEEMDSDGLPYWFEVIEKIYPFLKLGEWLGFRGRQLKDIEQNLHGVLDSSSGGAGRDTDELLSIQNELAEVQDEWVEASVQLPDEMEEMKRLYSDIIAGEVDLDFESSPPAPDGELIWGTKALMPIWVSKIQEWLSNVESLRERVGEKHDSTSSYLNNTIMAQSSISALSLQDEVTFLTRVLLVLTAVLLFVEVVDVQAIFNLFAGVFWVLFRAFIWFFVGIVW
ncbi:hypothetical protein [Salinigranum sp. GCM10025319]|uniref:hypothetical protein n=1 Tax=Salinigranum sp. GCM10025319 TaxID=3252687 RepID=UPI00360D8282